MLWTLQRYIFREMGKAFVLCAVGLVAVLGLGGGVTNMIKLEGVTAFQLVKIVALILPVAATMTLPIAALYAATVTYGRLSADNEFIACRSGGINIHLLFVPTLVISLVSAVLSFFFINFVIPGMIMNIDRFVGADLPRIIRQQLATPGRLALNRDKYRIYADGSDVQPGQGNGRTDAPSELSLNGVAFVEMDRGEWVRFGTAQSVLIRFGLLGGFASVWADMYNLTLYDGKAGRYYEVEHQATDPYDIPQSIPLKVKWLDLGDLLQYRRQTSLFPPVRERLDRLRNEIACSLFYRQTRDEFLASARELVDYGEVRFSDTQSIYTVRAPKLDLDPQDGRPLFSGGVTIVEQGADGLRRTVTADSAPLLADRTAGQDQVRVYLQAIGNVRIRDERSTGGAVHRDRERFRPVAVPRAIAEQAAAIDEDTLLQGDESLALGPGIDEKQAKLAEEVRDIARDITGVLHSRTAFSMSVFVLVILGAALGIVFRGAQVLTAFGISFIPSLFVITMIIMGKQLISNPTTTVVGIAVIWFGIAIVALGDLFVLAKLVRR